MTLIFRLIPRPSPTLLAAAGLALAAGALVAVRLLAGESLPTDLAWMVEPVATVLAAGLAALSLVLLWRLQTATQRGLADLAAGLHGLREELDDQKRLMVAALDAAHAAPAAMAPPPSPRAPERSALDTVASEVRVLQALVADLSSRSASAPAAEPRAGRGAVAAPASSAAQVQLRSVGAQDTRRASPVLDETDILAIVRNGLREGRVDVYVQPIVSLPQRKHRFYECFTRIRDADGNVVGPDRYLGGAEREGLIGAIDNMLLFRSVQLVRRVHKANREVGIFVNISEHSLADKRFFRDFAAFVAENKELAPYLIFEFAQAHVARHGAAVMLELERLARRGFRFSMDQVTDLNIDADALGERQFRFIKIDARRLLDAARDATAPLDLRRFKAALERNNIDLVVERIEDEQALLELLDYPIDFGQGYLFGEPRPAKTAA